MQKLIKFIPLSILSLFLAVLSPVCVSAMEYTPSTNLFEGTYSNNLIDMAMTQIDNFVSKKYVILQVDYNYYLVTGDDYVVNDSTITFSNSTIISAVRSTTGSYSSYYEYSRFNDSSTTVYAYYTVLSNIDTPKSVSSKRFMEYYTDTYTIRFFTFFLGCLLGIFIIKGRSY